MRVLHITPRLTGGGAERQLGYLTHELLHRGHEVCIAYLVEGPAPSQAAGLPAVRLKARRHRWQFLAEVVALVRRWRPDVVQTWFVESDIAGGLAAVLTRTPWIIREPNTAQLYDGRLKAPLRKLLALGASAVVANSAGGRDYWGKRARIIANAVPVADIDRVVPASLGKRPVAVYAGRLEAIKNVDVFIAAAAQAGVNAVVCGVGPERAALARLDSGVRFMGHIADVWAVIKGADLLVSLSDFEGSPNSVLEAFACRTPVVLSDIAAHRAIAGESAAAFVPLRDAGATAAAMRGAVEDFEGAAARARNARGVVESMTAEAMTDAYEALYESVALR